MLRSLTIPLGADICTHPLYMRFIFLRVGAVIGHQKVEELGETSSVLFSDKTDDFS